MFLRKKMSDTIIINLSEPYNKADLFSLHKMYRMFIWLRAHKHLHNLNNKDISSDVFHKINNCDKI